MKNGFYTLALTIAYFARLSLAVSISQNTVELSGNKIILEGLIITSGVYYSIVNSKLISLGGDVENNGSFYVTAKGPDSSSVVAIGNSFRNTGTLAFNSLMANNVSTCYIATTGQFSNTGDMYLGGGRIGSTGTQFTITSETEWSNEGNLVVQKFFGDSVNLTMGLIGVKAGASGGSLMKNDGSICLYNIKWFQTTDIIGRGCITVGAGSQLNLKNYENKVYYKFSPNQTIYLATPQSTVNIFGLSYAYNTPERYTVVGFGGGNLITVSFIPIQLAYNANAGVLTLSRYGLYVDFLIGRGYNQNLFYTSWSTAGPKFVSISYNAPVPNSVPSICKDLQSFPVASTVSLTSPSTSSNVKSETFVSKTESSSETSSLISESSMESLSSVSTLLVDTSSTLSSVTESAMHISSSDSFESQYTSILSIPSAGSFTSSASSVSEPDISFTATFGSTVMDSSSFIKTSALPESSTYLTVSEFKSSSVASSSVSADLTYTTSLTSVSDSFTAPSSATNSIRTFTTTLVPIALDTFCESPEVIEVRKPSCSKSPIAYYTLVRT